MNIEPLVSSMMRINNMARLWHWMTDNAQHHATYEQFLTSNETLTDSLMESALGNEVNLKFADIGVKNAVESEYSIANSTKEIREYRAKIFDAKKLLDAAEFAGSDELITILDDVTELSSKTLYMLKLK